MGFSPRACALRHHRCPVGRPTAQCRHMQRPMLTITWRPPVSVTRQVDDAHPASLPRTAGRKLVLYGNVPRHALYQAFHTSQEESARNSLHSMEFKGSSMLIYTPSPFQPFITLLSASPRHQPDYHHHKQTLTDAVEMMNDDHQCGCMASRRLTGRMHSQMRSSRERHAHIRRSQPAVGLLWGSPVVDQGGIG